GDGHRLAGTDVGVGEVGGSVTCGEHVAADAVVGEGDGGGRRAVVGLVLPGGRHRQAAGGDVGRGRGRGAGQGVVGGVGPRDRDAADGHRLVRADVLVREGGRRVVDGEHVAADPVVGEIDRGSSGAVIDLVLGGRRDRQGAGGDVGGGRGRGGGQGVV